MFLTAVRHDANNFEKSVVVQELELAINLAFSKPFTNKRENKKHV